MLLIPQVSRAYAHSIALRTTIHYSVLMERDAGCERFVFAGGLEYR